MFNYHKWETVNTLCVQKEQHWQMVQNPQQCIWYHISWWWQHSYQYKPHVCRKDFTALIFNLEVPFSFFFYQMSKRQTCTPYWYHLYIHVYASKCSCMNSQDIYGSKFIFKDEDSHTNRQKFLSILPGRMWTEGFHPC